MASRQRLSVVMIAKNEGSLLADCLSSVSFADEIILLDSGSSDNTREIASQYNVRVYQSDVWPGYGRQRQLAQGYASGDIIMMIDADERVTKELRLSIEQILRYPQSDTVYSIARSNLFLGRFMRHSGWYPDRVIRLYPRHYHYNNNLVHESLDILKARIIPLYGNLIHLTCRDFSTFQRKQLAYAEAWANERHQMGKRCSILSLFSHAVSAFLKTLLLRAGWLDGKQGWILAIVNAHYTFNKYAILWALNQAAKRGG